MRDGGRSEGDRYGDAAALSRPSYGARFRRCGYTTWDADLPIATVGDPAGLPTAPRAHGPRRAGVASSTTARQPPPRDGERARVNRAGRFMRFRLENPGSTDSFPVLCRVLRGLDQGSQGLGDGGGDLAY